MDIAEREKKCRATDAAPIRLRQTKSESADSTSIIVEGSGTPLVSIVIDSGLVTVCRTHATNGMHVCVAITGGPSTASIRRRRIELHRTRSNGKLNVCIKRVIENAREVNWGPKDKRSILRPGGSGGASASGLARERPGRR